MATRNSAAPRAVFVHWLATDVSPLISANLFDSVILVRIR